jgi:hypothetical protein
MLTEQKLAAIREQVAPYVKDQWFLINPRLLAEIIEAAESFKRIESYTPERYRQGVFGK